MNFRIVLVLFLLSLMSCSTKKEIVYLQDIEDRNNITFINKQYTIQPNDILKIDISTPNYESENDIYNVQTGTLNVNLETLKLASYLVSSEYIIKHKILGDLYVKNKTTEDLEAEIYKILKDLDQLKDPTVSVRVINAKFTITGEVARPGTFNLTEGRITILQALGFAGDLRITGKRKNILVVRQHNGTQTAGRVDITSADLFESPFYFVKQNDWIYVEPNGPKTKSAGYIGSFGGAIAVVSSLLSLGLLIYSITK